MFFIIYLLSYHFKNYYIFKNGIHGLYKYVMSPKTYAAISKFIQTMIVYIIQIY